MKKFMDDPRERMQKAESEMRQKIIRDQTYGLDEKIPMNNSKIEIYSDFIQSKLGISRPSDKQQKAILMHAEFATLGNKVRNILLEKGGATFEK